MNARPYKVINCLSQGFAVAGVLADGKRAGAPEADLEMVQWGMAADKAVELRDKLNNEFQRRSTEAPLQHKHD